MDDDLRPVPKHELRFDIEHALRKARSLWPRKHVHGDHNALRPVADAVVQHLALCGIRCFRNPRSNVARFLDADELARLGRGLDARQAQCPEAAAAIRLLVLTGYRRSEVLNLRRHDIEADAINLRDSKVGPRALPLGQAGRAHIGAPPGARDPEAFLFPRYAEGRGACSLATCWRAVCAHAKLGRLRLHDLRHTTAIQAVMSGENLPLVGMLLGHRRHRTTAGYVHIADAHLVEAVDRVGSLIAEAMHGTHG